MLWVSFPVSETEILMIFMGLQEVSSLLWGLGEVALL